jgi:hypothetical protein
MRTVPYSDVLNTAAANAGRTEDRIDASEQRMLQRFLTAKLRTVWNVCVWPDLINWPPAAVAVANRQFSKNEGGPGEMGDILGYYTRPPHRLDECPRFDFQEISGAVVVDANWAQVWPLYLPPTPNLMLYTAATNPTLLAYPVPEEFTNYLACHAASKLAVADQQYSQAVALDTEAQQELASAQMRAWDKLPVWLKRPRWGKRHRHGLGHVPGFEAVGYGR